MGDSSEGQRDSVRLAHRRSKLGGSVEWGHARRWCSQGEPKCGVSTRGWRETCATRQPVVWLHGVSAAATFTRRARARAGRIAKGWRKCVSIANLAAQAGACFGVRFFVAKAYQRKRWCGGRCGLIWLFDVRSNS